MSVFNFSQSQLPLKSEIDEKPNYKAHIPNINALNSDTYTLFLSKLILNSQCVGVAIEVIDIWYMVVTSLLVQLTDWLIQNLFL